MNIETQDPLYSMAKLIARHSTSFDTAVLQRELLIGYNRASRLMDQLIEDGFIERYETERGTAYRRPCSATMST